MTPTSVGTEQGAYYPAGRTRAELRALVGGMFEMLEGRATANGTTATLVDTRLSRFADTALVGRQIWVKYKAGSAAGYVAYVTGSVQSTGTLTFAPAMAEATATGDEYALFGYCSKEEIEQALNEVCRGGEGIQALTPNTDDSLDYSLNGISGLHRPSQIIGVYWRALGDNIYLPQPVRGWYIEEDHGLLTLRLPGAAATEDSLWIAYELGEGGLQHDDDRTTLPPELVKWRAVLWLLERRLIGQDLPGLEKFGQLLRLARERVRELEHSLPRASRPVVTAQWDQGTARPEQPWSAAGVTSRYGDA